MTPLVIAYIILGCTMLFALFIVVLKIAGKDMLFAFLRWIDKKGCEIFVLNANRHVDRYFKRPKDGTFTIDKRLYVTNPNKLEGLDDKMIKEAQQSINLGIQRLKKAISRLETKKDFIMEKLEAIKSDKKKNKENYPLLEQLNLQYTEYQNKIELLKSKLEKREQAYFMNRRPAYFYIENDPIPKDLFEFYTEMDSVAIENIIIRAQTKDPKGIKDMEKEISWIKKFVIMALIVGALGAFFAFKSMSMLEQIGQASGVVFTL